MAVKIRQKSFRQKIKAPDEFISFSQRAITFATENVKLILIIAVAFIAIIISGATLVKVLKTNKTESSRKTMDELLVASQDFYHKEYDAAKEKFGEIAGENKNSGLFNEIAQIGLANTYLNKKEYDKSIELFEKLLADKELKYPKEGLYLNLAISYEESGDKKKAIEIYRKLAILYPESGNISHYRYKISVPDNK